MRLQKNDDPICNYCMEIFNDFGEQLKENTTKYLKNICTLVNSVKFQNGCISFVDSIPIGLINEIISKVSPKMFCQKLRACKQSQMDDIEYVKTNSIEINASENDRFYDDGNDIPVEEDDILSSMWIAQLEEQLLQSEPDRLTKNSDVLITLINAVMMKR